MNIKLKKNSTILFIMIITSQMVETVIIKKIRLE